jgi:hypothetical protein
LQLDVENFFFEPVCPLVEIALELPLPLVNIPERRIPFFRLFFLLLVFFDSHD